MYIEDLSSSLEVMCIEGHISDVYRRSEELDRDYGYHARCIRCTRSSSQVTYIRDVYVRCILARSCLEAIYIKVDRSDVYWRSEKLNRDDVYRGTHIRRVLEI